MKHARRHAFGEGADAPPLPAPSRPSKTSTTRSPLCLIESCRNAQSDCSRRNSLRYCLLLNVPLSSESESFLAIMGILWNVNGVGRVHILNRHRRLNCPASSRLDVRSGLKSGQNDKRPVRATEGNRVPVRIRRRPHRPTPPAAIFPFAGPAATRKFAQAQPNFSPVAVVTGASVASDPVGAPVRVESAWPRRSSTPTTPGTCPGGGSANAPGSLAAAGGPLRERR